MKPCGLIILAGMSVLSVVIYVAGALAQDAGNDWKPLVDDHPRSELFHDYIEAVAPPQTAAEKSKDLTGPFRFPDNAVMDGKAKRTD